MDFQTIILCSLFVFLAFVVRGLTGFGSGPVMVPLMLLLLDIKLVVPTAAVHAVLTGFLLFFTFQTRKYVRKDVLFLLFPGGILGLMIGTYVLASFDSKLLKIVFGLSIMGLSLKILFGREELKKEVKNYVGLVAGLIGGIAGGIFSTGGPPVIIYLNRKIKEKEVIRATLVFYFLLHDAWRMILYGYAGLISKDVLLLSLYLLPSLILGNLAGSLLHIRINQLLFNRVIALVLLGIAVLLIVR